MSSNELDVGVATHAVFQDWSISLADLIGCLEAYVPESGRSYKSLFFWIDVFCADECDLIRTDWWVEDCRNILSTVRHVVIPVTTDVSSARAIASVKWGLFLASVLGKKIDIVLDIPSEASLTNRMPDLEAYFLNSAQPFEGQGVSILAPRTRAVAEAVKRTLGPENLDRLVTALVREWHAYRLWEFGMFVEAERSLTQVTPEKSELLGQAHGSVLQTMVNLAILLHRNSDLEGSVTIFEQFLSWTEVDLRIEILVGCFIYGYLMSQSGKASQARAIQNRMLDNLTLLEDKRTNLQAAAIKFAHVFLESPESSPNHQILDDIFAVFNEGLGSSAVLTLICCQLLASVEKNSGDYASASIHFKRVVEQWTKMFGASHVCTLRAMLELAATLLLEGEFGEAETWFRQALASGEHVADAQQNLVALRGLCGLLLEREEFGEAQLFLWRELATSEEVFGEESLECLQSAQRLADSLMKTESWHEAESLLNNVVGTRSKLFGYRDSETWESLESLVECLSAQKRTSEADAMLLKFLGLPHAESVQDLEILSRAAQNLIEKGLCKGAQQILEHVMPAAQKAEAAPDITLRASLALSQCLCQSENFGEALAVCYDATRCASLQGESSNHPTLTLINQRIQVLQAVGHEMPGEAAASDSGSESDDGGTSAPLPGFVVPMYLTPSKERSMSGASLLEYTGHGTGGKFA